MNLLGPELVRDLVSLIQRAEADDAIKVLVFKSADPDYFISHVDVTRIKEYREQTAKLTGEASIALLFRHLSASRLVSIVQIEGRVRVPLAPAGTTRARSMQTLTPTIRVEESAQHGRRPDRPASPHGFQGPLAATVPVLMRLSM